MELTTMKIPKSIRKRVSNLQYQANDLCHRLHLANSDHFPAATKIANGLDELKDAMTKGCDDDESSESV